MYSFEVTNHGSGACQIGGYFGVSIYDRSGHPLNDSARRTANMPGTGSGPEEPVTLQPGGVAHFKVEIGENPTGSAAQCPSIGSFHLIPPNDRSPVQVSVPASKNYWYCGTTFDVGPTIAGPVPHPGAATTGPPDCTAADVVLSLRGDEGGLSHAGVILVFTAKVACAIGGYPGVDGYQGSKRVVSAQRTPDGYLGGLQSGQSPPEVDLGPGQSASALLEGYDGPVNGQSCPSYNEYIVTPPNATDQATTAAPSTLCSPQVHPVVAGTNGGANTPG